MTIERKLLIAIGAALIAGMIGVACFAVGVYVGERGWTAQPPAPIGPQPQNRRPRDEPSRPDLPQPAQPPARPALVGVVLRADDATWRAHRWRATPGCPDRAYALYPSAGPGRDARRLPGGRLSRRWRSRIWPVQPRRPRPGRGCSRLAAQARAAVGREKKSPAWAGLF